MIKAFTGKEITKEAAKLLKFFSQYLYVMYYLIIFQILP